MATVKWAGDQETRRPSPEDALLIHDWGTCRSLPSQRRWLFYFTSQFIGASKFTKWRLDEER